MAIGSGVAERPAVDVEMVERADQVAMSIHGVRHISDLQDVIEKQLSALLDCEAVAVFLLEKRDRLTRLVRLPGPGERRTGFPVEQGLAGAVAREKGYCLCDTPDKDSRFMPDMDSRPGLAVRNLAVTAMLAGTECVGVIEVLNKRRGAFTGNDAYWLQRLAAHAAWTCQSLKRAEEGWTLLLSLAESMAAAVDDKDAKTLGHSDRTRQVAVALGRLMQLDAQDLFMLELAALLHDAGRLALSPENFERHQGLQRLACGYGGYAERLHMVMTEEVLHRLRLPNLLAGVREIAVAHHEKVDGTGFPRGLRSEQMSLPARILAVANAFDLLLSGRSEFNPGVRLQDQEAVKLLQAQAGKAYDADVVACLAANPQCRAEKRRYVRFEYLAPLEVTVLDSDTRFETRVQDLSEGGLQFVSPSRLPDRALVHLRMQMPHEAVAGLARVARQSPDPSGAGSQVGVFFLWCGRPA